MQQLAGILFCVFLAFIWLEYYRRSGMATHQSKVLLTSVFLLGIVSVLFVDFFNYISNGLFEDPFDKGYANDFVFTFFGVALIEEFAKFLPVALALLFFRKRFTDPIDYILLAGFSSIGFACFENLRYFNEHGFVILAVRSVTAMPSHLIFSTIFIYGFVQFRFKEGTKDKIAIPAYIFLAVMTHAVYDFTLLLDIKFSYIITLVIYFLMISVFMTMLGNAINNSQHFSMKRFIDSKKLTEFLLLNYTVLLLFTLVFFAFKVHNSIEFVNYFAGLIWKDVFIMLVLVFRICRIKIIPGRWNPIRPEMPFSITFRPILKGPLTPHNLRSFFVPKILKIEIKGERYSETYLNYFLNKNVFVQPVSSRKSFLKSRYKGILDLKMFLKGDESMYLLILYTENGTEYFYVRPKLEGRQRFGKRPIVALLRGPHLSEINEHYDTNDFTFIEWVVLK